MKGIAYGVGVGPGDPELMTLKAIRLINENDVIAVPGEVPTESVAYQIAVQAVPQLASKELVPIPMPMVRDRASLCKSHERGAHIIESYLDQGKNVVFLTLGDSSIYCTFTYLQTILDADGYQTELVSGIPSFCAAAARLNIPIAEWDEPVHIIPAAHKIHGHATSKEQSATEDAPAAEQLTAETAPDDCTVPLDGTCILMKSGRHMKEIKEALRQSGKRVYMVTNCGMSDERIYEDLDDIPDDASYFSLIIAKDTTP